MILLRYWIVILRSFVINLQCAPVSQSFDVTQNGFRFNPERNEGLAGGDMVSPPFTTSLMGRGVAIRLAWYHRWSGGVVPYEFAENITVNNSIFIVDQMRAMENLTRVNNRQCISFRPRNAFDL